MMTRTDFVRIALLSSASSIFAPSVASSQSYPDPTLRFDGTLVLSGGGARGAYQAGWIEGLRRAHEIADGSPLPGIDVICGSSIGALNGWFVATAQYTQLAELWHGIARENVFRLKKRYAATANPHAFIITKIVQALSLADGLTKDVQGLLDGDVVRKWIELHLDPETPLVIPLVFTVTNLDRRRPELFYQLPRSLSGNAPALVIDRMQRAVGTHVPIRLAERGIFTQAIRASTAIPVLFDPLVLESPEKTLDRYVDGGISDNNPIDVGRALAKHIYLILCDPPDLEREPYANALEIALGAFNVAEQRIFDAAIEGSRQENEQMRLFKGDSSLTVAQRSFMDHVLDAELYIGRPADTLPVESAEMDRQGLIDATYALGLADAQTGWKHDAG